MVSELGGAQISNLLETLPGIAQVLRSPVADAFVSIIRTASTSPDFSQADAEEILRYAVRRNLMTQAESEGLLVEVKEAGRKRPEKAASPEPGGKAKPKTTPKVAAPKAAAPKAVAPKSKAPAKPKAKAKPAAKAKAKSPKKSAKPKSTPARKPAKATRRPVRKR